MATNGKVVMTCVFEGTKVKVQKRIQAPATTVLWEGY